MNELNALKLTITAVIAGLAWIAVAEHPTLAAQENDHGDTAADMNGITDPTS